MAEITEYMKQLGVTSALFKKWQEEDVEADEPAPFQTHDDTLILAQRQRTATGEVGILIVEEVIVGKIVTDRVETISDTARRTDIEVEQKGERARAGRH